MSVIRPGDCTGSYGAHLWPSDFAGDREKLLTTTRLVASGMVASGAVGSIGASMVNAAAFDQQVDRLLGAMRRKYAAMGCSLATADEDALWLRARPVSQAEEFDAYLRYVRALLTPYNDRFSQHIRDRLLDNANVHLEFCGGTGTRKSSCAIGLADWQRHLEPGDLAKRLSFDLSELVANIATLGPGDVAIHDEYLQATGTGSKTQQAVVENQQDTLRRSGVSVYMCSPRRQEHDATHLVLETLLVNRERQFTVFMLWKLEVPLGVVALPWAPAHLWTEYEPWKDANTERSKSASFKDSQRLKRLALRVMEDCDFVEEVMLAAKKPTKKDVRQALEDHCAVQLSATEADFLTTRLYNLMYKLRPEAFERWYGCPPGPGITKLNQRCKNR